MYRPFLSPPDDIDALRMMQFEHEARITNDIETEGAATVSSDTVNRRAGPRAKDFLPHVRIILFLAWFPRRSSAHPFPSPYTLRCHGPIWIYSSVRP